MILVIVKSNHLVLCYISYICSYIRSDRGSGSNLMDELTDDDDDDESLIACRPGGWPMAKGGYDNKKLPMSSYHQMPNT